MNFQSFFVLDKSSPNSTTGTMNDYQLIGMVVYWVVIFLVNLRIWLFSKSFNVRMMFWIWVCPLLYPVFYYAYSSLWSTTDIYGFFN
jgi:hypothetical protein